MRVYNESTVDIPNDEGVHIKSAGAKGEKYVYKYVKYFRNAEGKPRNKAKAIGKLDVDSGKMFPNNNYFDLYNIDPALPDIDVWDYGYTYLVLKVCRDMGLHNCPHQRVWGAARHGYCGYGLVHHPGGGRHGWYRRLAAKKLLPGL